MKVQEGSLEREFLSREKGEGIGILSFTSGLPSSVIHSFRINSMRIPFQAHYMAAESENSLIAIQNAKAERPAFGRFARSKTISLSSGNATANSSNPFIFKDSGNCLAHRSN